MSLSVEEWTSGMDAKQLRACIARFEDELLALRARVAQLEAALSFLFEETKWKSTFAQHGSDLRAGSLAISWTKLAPPSRTRQNEARARR